MIVIQRSLAAKNLDCIKRMYSRSFASLWMTLFFICLSVHTQAQESLRVMFWNVENLFDTQDDPNKNDNEFLPDAIRHWTYFRYHDKLKRLAKTIVASGDERVPDLVGLCEVENDSCLYDLTRRSLLYEAGYRYVMTDSPDRRGVDVALLYQRGSFKLLDKRSIRILDDSAKREPTRDILHVSGRIVSGDTLEGRLKQSLIECWLPKHCDTQLIR